MKLRFWTNDDARHRATGDAVTAANDPGFMPRHCAGVLDNGLCLSHDHPGDALVGARPLTNFAGLDVPVPIKAKT